MSDLKPLSKKHQRFIAEYLKCFNGTRAYMAVYPKASTETARANASDLLSNTNVSEAIQDKLNAVQMSADEALQRIAEIARGDIGDFMSINSMGFELDLEAAREAQKTGVIKRVRQTVITVNGEKEDKETITTDIELHDKLSALRDILKMHNKFTERVDVTNSDGSLKPEEMKPSEIAARVAALLKDANHS
jgi:phage terminase small subunit